MTNKGWKTLKRKRRRTCRHGARRIWKLYSKRRPAGKLTWCEPPRDHLDYLWRGNIQRSSPENTGRAKNVTTLRQEKCTLRHAFGAHTFWLLILQLFKVKWIINNILSFTKGTFNNQWNFTEEKIGANFWNTLYIWKIRRTRDDGGRHTKEGGSKWCVPSKKYLLKYYVYYVLSFSI